MLNDPEEEFKWAIKSESRYGIEATLKLAQSELPVADDGADWDSDPMLLGVRNGVVDLTTGELRSGKQSDRITLHSEVDFEATAKCPRFGQFLKEVFCDRELIVFVQKAIGYSLTGKTSEQVLFLCHGTGANGKSTFFDVLRFVFGGYACNLPFSAFELKGRSDIPNEIAAIAQKRFVTAVETNESAQLNEARIKALTGSDPITARFLYHEFFEFEPTGKFWLAFNHRPTVSDDSPGFWRRIRLIPFTQSFPEDRRDPALISKLKAEAAGILNWAVQGALMWQAEGLKAPVVVIQQSENYREESDALGEFIENCCVISWDSQVTAKDLWSEYRSWEMDNNDRPMDRRAFSERMKSRGFKRIRAGHDRTYTWTGLRLKSKSRQVHDPAPVRADADVKTLLLNQERKII
jgi:putative DNA primase/helicase